MKDDEVREFLMRWLMEFGTEPVPWSRRGQCDWYLKYGAKHNIGVDSARVRGYFDFADDKADARHINQAGLNFIKEK